MKVTLVSATVASGLLVCEVAWVRAAGAGGVG